MILLCCAHPQCFCKTCSSSPQHQPHNLLVFKQEHEMTRARSRGVPRPRTRLLQIPCDNLPVTTSYPVVTIGSVSSPMNHKVVASLSVHSLFGRGKPKRRLSAGREADHFDDHHLGRVLPDLACATLVLSIDTFGSKLR